MKTHFNDKEPWDKNDMIFWAATAATVALILALLYALFVAGFLILVAICN